MHVVKNAVGDGKANDTQAVQDALDLGGVVVLESGKTYRCGSLRIHSETELCIEPGAVLLASDDIKDYLSPGGIDTDANRRVGTPVTRKPGFVFLHAMGERNITLSGGGVIDGCCDAFVHRTSPYHRAGSFYPRPTMVYLEGCAHVSVQGLTFRRAPFWTLHIAGCDNVQVVGVTIDNPLDVANSDGIDPDHSQNVRIVGCHIQCADDCICLKNTIGNDEYHPTRNVIIADCTLTSTSAALKIGTEGVADFENLLVENCIITGSNRGVSLQIRDGGSVHNVRFSNLIIETRRFSQEWWGTAEPISITCRDRDPQTRCGTVSHVVFEHIQATGENGVLCYADRPGAISDIVFRDVRVTLRKTSKWDVEGHDLRPGYQEPSLLREKVHPFTFVRCADITLDGVTTQGEGSCPAFAAEPLSVEDSTVKNR
jgi:polygalacturonase